MKQYASGHGLTGDLVWSPVQPVLEALDRAFYLTFSNVVPCNKPVLLALDVSGSMETSMILGTSVSARMAAGAMALVTAATEPNYEIVGFSKASDGFGGKWGGGQSGLTPIAITPRMRLDEVIKKMQGIQELWILLMQ